MVFEQYWGTSKDYDVMVSSENFFTSEDNVAVTYLFRRWMSGVTEIYLHVPTTNTYYINHVPSTPGYTISDDKSAALTAINVNQFGQDKTIFSHDPNDSYTTFGVHISKSLVNIDQLMGVYANGNSLPLGIYKETVEENTDISAAQHFNSYVAPTVLINQSEDEYDYVFRFACFGTDEQVVKLQFVDTVNNFSQKYYKIEFNPNGMRVDSMVKQRIRADGEQYKLRRNQYKWPNSERIFIGWTFSPYPAVNQDTDTLNGFYEDVAYMSSSEIELRCGGDMKNGAAVQLYAVWITYQFGPTDTTMKLQSNQQKFTISSAETMVDPYIGDKVVVKYEG